MMILLVCKHTDNDASCLSLLTVVVLLYNTQMDLLELDQLAVSIVRIARQYLYGLELHLSPRKIACGFNSHFRVSPRHCAGLWFIAEDSLTLENASIEKKHLLWTLNILKTHDTEHELKR